MPPDGFGAQMRAHLQQVESHNAAVLDAVAARLLVTIRRDGLVYVAGTGHSTGLLLETFHRAGGLACVYPLYHPGLLPLHGASVSTALERTPGLAQRLLDKAGAGPDDVAFVFSNSGTNPVPVELAEGLRERGARIVAVVSRPHLRRAPSRAGRKLDEVADDIVDTLVPHGDAAYPVADGKATAALSSLVGVYLWNLLLARLADRARQAGMRLPVWTSGNVEGGQARNEELTERYRPRIPAL